MRLHYHIVIITVISVGQLFFICLGFPKVGLDVEKPDSNQNDQKAVPLALARIKRIWGY